jgi:ribosomal protein S12 methylthiotransferase accessory factor YcaO
VCLVYDDRGSTFYQQRASGSGCHPYRRIALSRAITEALQSRLTHISGVRDDVYWSSYRHDLRTDEPSTKRWIGEVQSEPECVEFSKVVDACPMDHWSNVRLDSRGHGSYGFDRDYRC